MRVNFQYSQSCFPMLRDSGQASAKVPGYGQSSRMGMSGKGYGEDLAQKTDGHPIFCVRTDISKQAGFQVLASLVFFYISF